MITRPFKNSLNRHADGFTLTELAITVLILGIMLSAGVNLYARNAQQEKVRLTQENLRLIASALADYAEVTNRLPCPADPTVTDALFGWERGVVLNDIKAGTPAMPIGSCPNNNQWEGLVPFQTLDLPYQTTLDGWGNQITYAISPVFAQNNDPSLPANLEGDQVHDRCRNAAWVVADSGGTGQGKNRLPPKARFCCAVRGNTAAFSPATDLDIRDNQGNTLLATVRNTANYGDMDERLDDVSNVPVPATSNITAPAFILISHGEDGDDAYGLDGAQRADSFAGGMDDENGDQDRRFIDAPMSTRRNGNYYDDIVLWRTQDGVMSQNGVSSCQYP